MAAATGQISTSFSPSPMLRSSNSLVLNTETRMPLLTPAIVGSYLSIRLNHTQVGSK